MLTLLLDHKYNSSSVPNENPLFKVKIDDMLKLDEHPDKEMGKQLIMKRLQLKNPQ